VQRGRGGCNTIRERIRKEKAKREGKKKGGEEVNEKTRTCRLIIIFAIDTGVWDSYIAGTVTHANY
jgi:hypothetical protein